MPPALVDDLVEQVLLRLPPHEPAGLVRAALVCRRWRRLVSDPGFHRRFREFHRRPPVLGMVCSRSTQFVPLTAFCSPPQADRRCLRPLPLDARHGRVLLIGIWRRTVIIWDPIADEERELPLPVPEWESAFHGAAILCSAAAGACNHFDCHHGPFLVVYVCSLYQFEKTFVYTYSSDADAWGDPVCAQQHGYKVNFLMGSALVGNTLYFGSVSANTALKYNLESRQMSWMQLPSPSQSQSPSWVPVLTTTEDGALALAFEDDSKLYMWSRKDAHEVDAIWERSVIIDLKTVFPVDVILTKVFVIGSADGLGIIFMWMDGAVYTIDLKTYKVKKVYKGTTGRIFPYVSFYTPALGGTCTGKGPSATCSSA